MNERTRLTSREAPPMPDTFAQAMFRYLAGQIAVYLPAPFDPAPMESRMADLQSEIDALTKSEADDEARAAANAERAAADKAASDARLADMQTQLADLQAKVDAGVATPAQVQALEALRAKIDARDPSTAPAETPTGVVTEPPADTGVVAEPTDQPPA